MVHQTTISKKTRKCTKCGGCCLSAPCMMIPIGTEVYRIFNGIKVHICPYLNFKGFSAFCNNKEMYFNEKCTSSKSYNDIKIRIEIFQMSHFTNN